MEKASIVQTIQKVLKNTCGLEYAFGDDVALSQRSKISNNIHEVASELNRLYNMNFQGVLLRSMTVNQIANEINSKMAASSKADIVPTIHRVLVNTCGLVGDIFGNDVALSQSSVISNHIHEVASELNRLYNMNFQGVLLRSMTVNQIANEIISKITASSKSQGPKVNQSMEKTSIVQDIQKVLKNTCGLLCAFGNDVVLSQRTLISNNIHEVASELNRLYKTSFPAEMLMSMTVNEIADEIILKMAPSSKSQGPKERHLNIVVVGRAGVGKSSFLNYAAGKKVFETGIGDPVTQSYFDVIDVEKPEKKVVYSLYDTKGLEAGNTEEWKNAIYSEIERRDESDNIYDWFHTIIYCIDASSKRIQPFEINAIKEIAEKGSVLVLLTKKDLVTPDILQNLRQQILTEVGDKVQVLSVCNVSTRTRKGESKASGLEEVLRVSFLGLWEKASKVLPRRVIKDVVNINQILLVDKDLADLCAYASLTCCRTDGEEDEKVFVDICDISEIVGVNLYKMTIEKSLLFSCFKKISGISDVEVRDVSRGIQIILDDEYFPPLFSLPKQLDHDELDEGYYRGAIDTYLRLLDKMFTELTVQMKSRVGDIKFAVGKNGKIVTEILKFYNDVNGTKQKPLFSHKTDEAIATLEHIDYYELGKKFSQLSWKVQSSIREIANTFISSGAERREANSRYAQFRGWVTDKVSYLESCVEQFISSYEAELHSYGQYCIREDEFAGNNAEASKEQEENKGLSQLRALIKVTLSNGVILPKERMMLETMAEMQGISRSELDKLIMEVERG